MHFFFFNQTMASSPDDSRNDADDYMIVLEPLSKSYSRVANRWKHFVSEPSPSNNSSRCHQDSGVPWKPHQSSKESSILIEQRKTGPLRSSFQRTDSQKKVQYDICMYHGHKYFQLRLVNNSELRMLSILQ